MTKVYDIVHYNGFMYAVDKEAIITNGWKGIAYKTDVKRQIFEHFYTTNTWYDDARMVVASNDPSLNLPLLPSIEEDIEKLATNYWKNFKNEMSWVDDLNDITQAFKEGYKAASAKKYTEEDIRKAFREGRDFEASIQNTGYDDEEVMDEEQFIQSLNHLPIAVEVEMYPIYEDKWIGEMVVPVHVDNVLLVDENNFVKVIKWIYE